jgi:hypothetical protein
VLQQVEPKLKMDARDPDLFLLSGGATTPEWSAAACKALLDRFDTLQEMARTIVEASRRKRLLTTTTASEIDLRNVVHILSLLPAHMRNDLIKEVMLVRSRTYQLQWLFLSGTFVALFFNSKHILKGVFVQIFKIELMVKFAFILKMAYK